MALLVNWRKIPPNPLRTILPSIPNNKKKILRIRIDDELLLQRIALRSEASLDSSHPSVRQFLHEVILQLPRETNKVTVWSAEGSFRQC